MDKMDFSIVIPVYNAEKYIEECVRSAINQQKGDYNYEIILVDDGSIDLSGSICERLANENEIISCYHQKNGGQIRARRRGISEASGDYILLLDADDMIRSDALITLFEIVNKCNPDIVIYEWEKIDTTGNIKGDVCPGFFSDGEISKTQLIKVLLTSWRYNSLCIKLIKRSIYLKCPYNVEGTKIRNGEDLVETVSLLNEFRNIYYTSEKIYYYRDNNESITHSFSPDEVKSLDIVRPILFTYLLQNGLDSPDNIRLFYIMYCRTICDALKRSILFCADYITILTEMTTYEYVVKTKDYYSSLPIHFAYKIMLFLFYKKHWKMLKLYIKGIDLIRGGSKQK